MTRGVVLAAAAAAALAFGLAARAGQRIDGAVAALRSDPVYVDPSAELAIGPAEQTRLHNRLGRGRPRLHRDPSARGRAGNRRQP
jgi:hypothetical protein